jgi:hypothetical protein
MNAARSLRHSSPLVLKARVPQPRPFFRPLTTTCRTRHASVSPIERPVEDYSNGVAAMGRKKSGKALKIRKYPTFEKLEDERLYRKQHLAAAYRVFAQRGFDEGVAGHISVRDPILTDHFCTPYVLGGVASRHADDVQGSTPSAHTSRRSASQTSSSSTNPATSSKAISQSTLQPLRYTRPYTRRGLMFTRHVMHIRCTGRRGAHLEGSWI